MDFLNTGAATDASSWKASLRTASLGASVNPDRLRLSWASVRTSARSINRTRTPSNTSIWTGVRRPASDTSRLVTWRRISTRRVGDRSLMASSSSAINDAGAIAVIFNFAPRGNLAMIG